MLAVLAANDTNTASDRESLQAEVDQLVNELDRIATTTNFNNNKILDGSFIGATFHVGANSRETITVTTVDSRSTQLGRQSRNDGVAVSNEAFQADDVVINSVTVRATEASDDTVSTTLNSSSAIAKAKAINDVSGFTGVKAIVNESSVTGGAITALTLDSSNYISINGRAITGFNIQNNDADGTLVTQINAEAGETGVVASLDESYQLVLTSLDGRNIDVQVFGNGGDTGLAAGVTLGSLTLQSEDQITVTTTANGTDRLGHGIAGGGTAIFGVNSSFAVSTVDITSRESSNIAIEVLDVAIGQVSAKRADLGAIQNRLESTVSNLTTTSENLSASRSRVLDADFAAETALLSRNQIIQQAGVSVLAQANQQPQIALSLLG